MQRIIINTNYLIFILYIYIYIYIYIHKLLPFALANGYTVGQSLHANKKLITVF